MGRRVLRLDGRDGGATPDCGDRWPRPPSQPLSHIPPPIHELHRNADCADLGPRTPGGGKASALVGRGKEKGCFVSKLFLGHNLLRKANPRKTKNLLITENLIILNSRDYVVLKLTLNQQSCLELIFKIKVNFSRILQNHGQK